MAASRIRRALTGRRRWIAVGAAAAVLAAGGTAVAVAATGDTVGPLDTGRQRAVDAARKVVPDSRIVSVEPDHEHGVRVWEVELRTSNGAEHEVDVSVANGKVVSHGIDHDHDDDVPGDRNDD
ncbi:PepSY domain-containing protein [Streptomyces sp. NPDC058000]|uniref:PepSY domain-containing protein n=1 Tax=Streptomyces sp. NPDC058000 TaxID=3346299 RepID=UPI0036F0476C